MGDRVGTPGAVIWRRPYHAENTSSSPDVEAGRAEAFPKTKRLVRGFSLLENVMLWELNINGKVALK